MTRIRCRDYHCGFNQSGFCISDEIEYDPDNGCLTMEPREDADLEEEQALDEELEDLGLEDEDEWEEDEEEDGDEEDEDDVPRRRRR
jgi:hypothetical protein